MHINLGRKLALSFIILSFIGASEVSSARHKKGGHGSRRHHSRSMENHHSSKRENSHKRKKHSDDKKFAGRIDSEDEDDDRESSNEDSMEASGERDHSRSPASIAEGEPMPSSPIVEPSQPAPVTVVEPAPVTVAEPQPVEPPVQPPAPSAAPKVTFDQVAKVIYCNDCHSGYSSESNVRNKIDTIKDMAASGHKGSLSSDDLTLIDTWLNQ